MRERMQIGARDTCVGIVWRDSSKLVILIRVVILNSSPEQCLGQVLLSELTSS